MTRGFIPSIMLHVIIGAILIYELPNLMKREIRQDYAMVVDMVDVSELTNVKVKKSARKVKKKTKAKKAPKSTNVKKEKAQVKKEIKVAAKDKDLEKVPAKKVKQKKPEPKKAKVVKPKPKKKKESFEKSILKSLEEESQKREEAKVDKKFSDLADALQGETNKEYNEYIPMSISEIDAIKSQITRNWNTASFSGAKSMGMEVIINIKLDMDGNVLNAKPVIKTESSPYYRAFVDSALRAVKVSSPIRDLKKEKFSSWREIEFRFDSSGMIY